MIHDDYSEREELSVMLGYAEEIFDKLESMYDRSRHEFNEDTAWMYASFMHRRSKDVMEAIDRLFTLAFETREYYRKIDREHIDRMHDDTVVNETELTVVNEYRRVTPAEAAAKVNVVHDNVMRSTRHRE